MPRRRGIKKSLSQESRDNRDAVARRVGSASPPRTRRSARSHDQKQGQPPLRPNETQQKTKKRKTSKVQSHLHETPGKGGLPGSTNPTDETLPAHIFEEILLQLPIDDVHHCMSVCKTWCEILRRNGFWKSYVQRNFDMTPVDDIVNSELVGSTLGSWSSEENGFYNYELTEPAYVFKPYPNLLKCDVITGAGYKPMGGQADAKAKPGTSKTASTGSKSTDYHNLAVSLGILRHILQRSQEFECVVPAYGNEGDGTVMVWLAPYEDSKKPPKMDWVMSYFNANPELYKRKDGFNEQKQDELTAKMMKRSFGIKNLIDLPKDSNDSDDDDDDEDDEDDDDDDDDDDESEDINEKKKSFQKFLQRIYRPSCHFYCGENIMNSVLYFHYTTLAPGYVGGTMSDLSMT